MKSKYDSFKHILANIIISNIEDSSPFFHGDESSTYISHEGLRQEIKNLKDKDIETILKAIKNDVLD
jgi:hypothetical protein